MSVEKHEPSNSNKKPTKLVVLDFGGTLTSVKGQKTLDSQLAALFIDAKDKQQRAALVEGNKEGLQDSFLTENAKKIFQKLEDQPDVKILIISNGQQNYIQALLEHAKIDHDKITIYSASELTRLSYKGPLITAFNLKNDKGFSLEQANIIKFTRPDTYNGLQNTGELFSLIKDKDIKIQLYAKFNLKDEDSLKELSDKTKIYDLNDLIEAAQISKKTTQGVKGLALADYLSKDEASEITKAVIFDDEELNVHALTIFAKERGLQTIPVYKDTGTFDFSEVDRLTVAERPRSQAFSRVSDPTKRSRSTAESFKEFKEIYEGKKQDTKNIEDPSVPPPKPK